MKIIVLGAGAGGGFPQWNAASANNLRAFAHDPSTPHATQCSLAVSADAENWLLLNASPDIRQQIIATPELHPRQAPRSSPIKAVILTGADIDAIAGLLTLRERQPFTVWATDYVLDVIRQNPVFNVLNAGLVHFRTISAGQEFEPLANIKCLAIESPGKPPLHLEFTQGIEPADGTSIGVKLVSAAGRSLVFMPSCAEVSLDMLMAFEGADILYFDGTLCVDEEMLRSGEGQKSARRMGHMSMDQSIARLRDINVGERYFIHINNTNPTLNRNSPERKIVEAAGWHIAEDGTRIEL